MILIGWGAWGMGHCLTQGSVLSPTLPYSPYSK